MQYEIKGGNFPIVLCTLSKNETIVSEKGGMSWMSKKIKMETSTGGGILKGISRSFSGESMFLNYYTAQEDGQQIAFASSYAGRILPIKLEHNKSIVAQKRAMLAMETGVDFSIHFRKKLGVGFFGGEGFILQKFSGEGHVFLEIDGDLVEYNLASGEEMYVDQGYLAAMDSSVDFEIETVKGFKNVMFGGEGLFLASVRGPGRVWLQTMPMANLVNEIVSHIPSK